MHHRASKLATVTVRHIPFVRFNRIQLSHSFMVIIWIHFTLYFLYSVFTFLIDVPSLFRTTQGNHYAIYILLTWVLDHPNFPRGPGTLLLRRLFTCILRAHLNISRNVDVYIYICFHSGLSNTLVHKDTEPWGLKLSTLRLSSFLGLVLVLENLVIR